MAQDPFISVSNFKMGTVTLSSSNQTLTIPNIGFTPDDIRVILTTHLDVPKTNTIVGCQNNEQLYANHTSADGFYVGTNTKGTITYGDTTTIKGYSSSYKWAAGTYFYTAYES